VTNHVEDRKNTLTFLPRTSEEDEENADDDTQRKTDDKNLEKFNATCIERFFN
tara:strand:- start:3853 stop:4011 length:159 start_codon:yes stop_codon:yes gene_type:complete